MNKKYTDKDYAMARNSQKSRIQYFLDIINYEKDYINWDGRVYEYIVWAIKKWNQKEYYKIEIEDLNLDDEDIQILKDRKFKDIQHEKIYEKYIEILEKYSSLLEKYKNINNEDIFGYTNLDDEDDIYNKGNYDG